MSNYERLEDLRLAKEFPASKKELGIVTIYEDDFDWLLKQAEMIDRIKSFCHDEADTYADFIKQKQHDIKGILFEGKQEAFQNVINHIKNLEEEN